MTRAVLEGVAYGLRDGLELMLAAGTPRPTQIRASGGGLASPVWRQILSDVLEAEIDIPSTTEGAAYGAAVLAAVGAGWFATVDEACARLVSASPVATPGSDVAVYSAGYEIYRTLYPTLAASFHRLGEAAAKA
jgi:xylulokinase